ncbi:hypothetical protein Ddye_029566 [Dipteronia dyeriana]|uniref:Uncharacterized protein n=1 Tax=Dipteronia dyeriana TaxID=168575 RepID=A0AAD9TFS1_9ROSI|nr:hypothetical protein Ddye_029566 [Dipteronia dyeriana]
MMVSAWRSMLGSVLCHLGHASVEYSPRATNSFVDSLAKKGSGGEGDFISWSL